MRPRRLLSISHSYSVGLNRRLADALAEVGRGRWDVTAVAPTFFHGDLRPLELERGDDGGCRVVGVPARFTGSPHLFSYGRRLRALLHEGWDLVHCWEEPYVVAGGQVALWTPRGTPLVYWTAQNIPKRYPPPFSWIERFSLARCSGWLACGESVAEALRPRGYADIPHTIAPLGVDLDVFRPDPEAAARVRTAIGWNGDGAPVIGYLGRFVPEKGVGVLLSALERQDGDWRALFVGGGPLEDELHALAARHPGRVHVATDVPHDAVPEWIAAMDVLAAPSLTTPTWREQFGRMLIEAFACGVPVAASDSGEIPHVVGDAGLVIPEGDEDAWTAALARLLADPELRRDLGARGLTRVCSEYAWPVIAERTLRFFDRIVARRAEAAA